MHLKHFMAFVGSTSCWGEQQNARLCELLVEGNNGMAQQIQENRHDLLDLMKLEQLNMPDDLTLPYHCSSSISPCV
jgi:hypothetical protein